MENGKSKAISSQVILRFLRDEARVYSKRVYTESILLLSSIGTLCVSPDFYIRTLRRTETKAGAAAAAYKRSYNVCNIMELGQ